MDSEIKKVIAVDLDGTLAHYDGWKGALHIGDPVQNIVRKIKKEQSEGAKIYIFTARVSDPHTAQIAADVIDEWCKKHDIQHDGITAVKHKFFTEFWDDRAVQVIKNAGVFVTSDFDAWGGDIKINACKKENVKRHSALDTQVGGNHYKKYEIQPIEFVVANNIPVLEANVQKYILRHSDKNGIEDLRKAMHYLELMAEMYYSEKL